MVSSLIVSTVEIRYGFNSYFERIASLSLSLDCLYCTHYQEASITYDFEINLFA